VLGQTPLLEVMNKERQECHLLTPHDKLSGVHCWINVCFLK
jgi:hypothetical protein